LIFVPQHIPEPANLVQGGVGRNFRDPLRPEPYGGLSDTLYAAFNRVTRLGIGGERFKTRAAELFCDAAGVFDYVLDPAPRPVAIRKH
jgi:hypothetical protein